MNGLCVWTRTCRDIEALLQLTIFPSAAYVSRKLEYSKLTLR